MKKLQVPGAYISNNLKLLLMYQAIQDGLVEEDQPEDEEVPRSNLQGGRCYS